WGARLRLPHRLVREVTYAQRDNGARFGHQIMGVARDAGTFDRKPLQTRHQTLPYARFEYVLRLREGLGRGEAHEVEPQFLGAHGYFGLEFVRLSRFHSHLVTLPQARMCWQTASALRGVEGLTLW